jgi:membrane-associated phospholipid phosphatase
MDMPNPPTAATSDRVLRAFGERVSTAGTDALIPAPVQIINGDAAKYGDKSGTYSKGVLQASVGLVDLAAFASFRKALDSGKAADFDAIVTGGGKTLNNPQGGIGFELEGLDNAQFTQPPAPAVESELYATELVELYWASLLRDVAFTDYAGNAIAQAAAAELSTLPAYRGPKTGAGQVTPDLLFRGGLAGETVGPYLSQFILQKTAFGALPIDQKYNSFAAGQDFVKTPALFQQVQNGIATSETTSAAGPYYMHDARGLGAYTHADVLYEAYFIAFLVLSGMNAAANPGSPYAPGTAAAKTQNGFATFGGPDIASVLAAVAGAAIKAVWYQKWFVHLRHRPESGGALVYLAKTPSAPQAQARPSDLVLNSQAVARSFAANGSYLLSQAFPEGSPTHPAYPTGHGTVAGACITVLKFFFDCSKSFTNLVVPSSDGSTLEPYALPGGGSLDFNGELHKLAHNISFGHGILAGIHWRSDTDTSIALGEAVAIAFLRDRARTYNEKFSVTLTKIDGSTATIGNM